MILQRLSEHYDRLLAQGTPLPVFGCSVQRVSFCLLLSEDGALLDVQDERLGEGKKARARETIVPGQGKPSGSGLNPCFLWDNAEYILGWSPDAGRLERACRGFEAFRELHLRYEPQIHHSAFRAVCRFLRDWSPGRAEEWTEKLTDRATNFGVFRIANQERYVHDSCPVPENLQEDAVVVTPAMCLVTGEMTTPARLHEPKIKGVNGQQSSGALLVSFNAPAFTSYNREQSYNAPVGVATAFKYANALNYLLSQRERRISLGDATVVYWADHTEITSDLIVELFSGVSSDELSVTEEDRNRVLQAKLLLEQMRNGTMEQEPPAANAGTRFFILGLSPNAARLSVRLWIEEDAATLRRRLFEHVRDLALRGSRDDRMVPLWKIVAATGRAEQDAKGRLKSYDTKGVSPQLAGELARSVLTGAAYPESLLATMIRRIRADMEVSFERASAIKAVLTRNARLSGKPTEVPMELNNQETNIAYRCGCLFAMIEKAQADSLGSEINATVKDRYFGAAMATPAIVFPRLFRLNNHHLAKLASGSKIYYERLIAGIVAAPFSFPSYLPLKEQGKFVIGYFQQRQSLYIRKDRNPTPEVTEQ